MIYFIRAGYSGPVKIGKADIVSERVATLQTAHYETLNVIREMPGDYAEESWLRRRFNPLWIRGEWFHFSPDMLAIQLPENLDHVPGERPEALPLNGPSPSEIIDRLGGTARTARIFGFYQSRVSNWRKAGIPPEFFGALVRASGGSLSYAELETQRIPESEAA